MSSTVSTVPKPHPGLEFYPIDTTSTSQKYLAKAGSERQWEMSETLYQFVRLIDGKRTTEEIAAAFTEETGKPCSVADAERIIETYLIPRGLVAGENGARATDQQRSYLYVRIPLFSQRLLRPLTSFLQALFAPRFFYPALALIALFHTYFYLFVEKPIFSFQTITGADVLLVYALLLATTLFHELGHSSACHRFGAKHGDIGIGLYLYFPVFYADVTDVWRLKRTERAVVDFAGMYFQFLLVPLLYGGYLVVGHAALLYTIYALNFSIVGSLNPLLRFDGYWLASDLTGIPNLRKRAKEALLYLARRLTRRDLEAPPVLQLQPKAKFFLYTYALVSNLFFAFFIYHVVLHLPSLLKTYPTMLIGFLSGLPQDILTLNLSALLQQLSSLLFPTLMMVMLGMIIYRFGLRGIQLVRKKAGL